MTGADACADFFCSVLEIYEDVGLQEGVVTRWQL